MSRRETLRKSTVVVATVILAMGPLAACADPEPSGVADDCEPIHEFETVEEGVLTVSAYSLPPWGVITGGRIGSDGAQVVQGGELGGVDGDILAEIAARECLEMTVNSTAAIGVFPAVQNGVADVAAPNWFRTERRGEILDQSDPVYSDEVGIISRDGVSDFTELKDNDATVGTVAGYVYVRDLRDYFGENFVLYTSELIMLQDLRAGHLDAGVSSYGVGAAYVEMTNLQAVVAEPHDEIRFSREPAQVNFPVQQGNTDLLEAINDGVAELRESGRLAEILEAHGIDPSAAEPGEPRLMED